MKSKTMILNQRLDGMRTVVAAFRAEIVAPRLLKEEGWDTSEIQLTDDEVADLFRDAGVKLTKRGFSMSIEQGQKLCAAIDGHLSIRYMIARGWLETDIIDGKECIRASEAGVAECAALLSRSAA